MWGPDVRPSQFPLLKESPSRRPGTPARGLRAGQDGEPASPQCEAQVLSWSAPAVAAPDRRGPAGAKEARAVTARGARGRVRGARGAGVGHTSRARGDGAGYGAPRPPLWGGWRRRRKAGGGARSDAAGGDGAPLLVYRGAVWPGWAIQAVSWGRRV